MKYHTPPKNVFLYKRGIGIVIFDIELQKIVKSINKLPEKKNYYPIIRQIIKMAFAATEQYVGIRTIEVIVANLFRSDGHVYWLDKYIKQSFDLSKLGGAIT